MAKITHYGQWLDISSLNPVDKKNYLTSVTLFLFGAVAWGIHLSSVGIFYDTPDIENAKSSFYTAVRVVVIISWIVSTFYYMKFLKTQDELVIRWNEFIGSWGAIGFLSFGMLMSLLSPYLEFKPGFYELFLAFAIGCSIGGLRFHNKYLAE